MHLHNLLMRMFMRRGMCASLDFPPHDHSLLPSNNAPLYFVGHTLPGQSFKFAEAGYYRHYILRFVSVPD
jgi:hypothetical protein